jgi:hypothetical protein
MGGLVADILAVFVLPILSIIAQDKFMVVQRWHKFWAWVKNSPIKITVSLSVSTNKTPKEIGSAFMKVWKSEGKKVIEIGKSPVGYAISNNNYDIRIMSSDEDTIIETSEMDTSFRQVKEKVADILGVMDSELKETIISKISLCALLPYKLELFSVKSSQGIHIEDYSICLKDKRWKSSISVKLNKKSQEIHVSDKSREEVKKVIEGIFNPI